MTKLRPFLAASLAAFLLALGLVAATAAPAGAHPAACGQHTVNPTMQIAQGQMPGGGGNAWRLTTFYAIPSDGCGGIWLSSPANCGWFSAERVSPLPATDWMPASVCTTEQKIVNVCATCAMAEGYTFTLYQMAGSPYSGAHAPRVVLWF